MVEEEVSVLCCRRPCDDSCEIWLSSVAKVEVS